MLKHLVSMSYNVMFYQYETVCFILLKQTVQYYELTY